MERPARALVLAAAIVAAFALASCETRVREVPAEEIAARAQKLIESGNDAFKAGDFELAAKRYAAATAEKADDPAAYYGLGMALSKLGRDEQAREAYAKARELAHSESAAPHP